MSKSNQSGIPGGNMMTDTFDFFKNMWGSVPGMKLPGMVMPTMSVDEIDKQIKDLKAVESWLALNMNMLQGTIQALEVQRTTIMTLQTMGESFTAAMQSQASAASAMAGNSAATADKPAFHSPFTSSTESKPASEEKTDATAGNTDGVGGIPPIANPAAWWGMLQDQFKQAVDTATAMTPSMPDGGSATSAPATSIKPESPTPAPRKRKSPPKKDDQ